AAGEYTVTNNVPGNPNWFSGSPDHTPGDVNGFMAFYNSSNQPGEFFSQTLTNLCGSSTYEFAAWVANAVNPALQAGSTPDITFRIEQLDGTLLAFYDTGPIGQSPVFTWQQYGFYFTLPLNTNSIVLRMINNGTSAAGISGSVFAIDDITFRPCGPVNGASFASATLVDSISLCQGSTSSLYGNISAGYTNPNYVWQVSSDSGKTWLDLPNSNSLQITTVVPTTEVVTNLKYRLQSAEGNNINSLNCRISSNLITLTALMGSPLQVTPDSVICPGASIQLQVNGAVSYTWTPSQFLNNPNIPNPVASPDSATRFYVTGTDIHQCLSEDSVTVTIRPKPVFQAPGDTSVCKGQSVKLNGNNGNGYLYAWTPAASLDNPASPTPVATPDSSTTFNVLISDFYCAFDSSFQVLVAVNQNPVVNAGKSNDIDCSTTTAQLTATGADSYLWTPATDLNDPHVASPTASIDSTTTFVVQGTDQQGCYAFDSIIVKVTSAGKASFVVPNAFTPNGDGLNDCFGIRRWGNVTIEEFSIYNRWGQRVFTTRNASQCWDGTFNGEQQPAGGYPYVIKAKTFCGDVTRTGMVMLIR
ncbi:MAG TPA: gliding motility-associated C-terminal domain-containing protein, partial [Puia sp.]|nr:gliding motility-associated C-terminal domain-containing protein [Puia sp.]